MAYFWRCPYCDKLGTYDDDEEPWCHAECSLAVVDELFGKKDEPGAVQRDIEHRQYGQERG